MGDNDAPFNAEQREKWPVPPEIRAASANDAFMWYCSQGMRQFYPTYGEPESTEYNDYTGHVIVCGGLRLTLEWGDWQTEPDDPDAQGDDACQ